jgi:hypothetical protein
MGKAQAYLDRRSVARCREISLARTTTRPSSALRSQPSARRSISRHRRNAAQLPSSPNRHPILRDAAIQECAQHRERAVAEAGLLLSQARSTRYSSSSSNGVSFAQAHANGPETTQRPLRALPFRRVPTDWNGTIFLTVRQGDLFSKPTLIEKHCESRKKYLSCYAR